MSAKKHGLRIVDAHLAASGLTAALSAREVLTNARVPTGA